MSDDRIQINWKQTTTGKFTYSPNEVTSWWTEKRWDGWYWYVTTYGNVSSSKVGPFTSDDAAMADCAGNDEDGLMLTRYNFETGEILTGNEPERVIQPSWEDVCEKGRIAADALDSGRWLLGELASQVQDHWGDTRLNDFAIQVAVEKKRIYEYRSVYHFYEFLPVAEFREANPMLRYSHYRDAMRLGDAQQAMNFLNECSTQGLTVEQARLELVKRLGKPEPPQKLFDGALPVGQITAALMQQFDGRRVVRCVVYAVPDEASAQ